MFRIPLWGVVEAPSRALGTSFGAAQFPVLDLHELAAGKLAALLARRASRDLFDAHHLLTHCEFEREKLRAGFVLFGAVNRRDWRGVSAADIDFEPVDLKNQLLPTLHHDYAREIGQPHVWAERLISECRTALGAVLPLSGAEREFLDRLLDHGEVVPSLLSSDIAWADRVKQHPLLEWKALNVQRRMER